MTRSKGNRSRGAALAAIVAALAAGDACWLLAASEHGAAAPDPAFARATCGIGLGPVTAPAWSFFGVDPRTESCCESELFPLPGLACPDPTHGTGVSRIASRR